MSALAAGLLAPLLLAAPIDVPSQPVQPNLVVVLDSSGSMTWTLDPESFQSMTCQGGGTYSYDMGVLTWGDGSQDFPGLDTNGDGIANDSRLFIAKSALTDLVNGLVSVNLGLVRYHQTEGLGINSPNGQGCENWYRVPGQLRSDGTAATLNYDGAGSCGQPADVLVPLGGSKAEILRWMDGKEDFLNGDKEIRADGSTPIAAALDRTASMFQLTTKCDGNYVLLMTDGEENCGGDPVDSARKLAKAGIRTFVVGFGPSVSGSSTLDDVARAGGTAIFNGNHAFFAGSPAALKTVLRAITAFVRCAQACLQDSDCANGDVCQNGKCGPPCATDPECPGQVCDHQHCVPTCQQDPDCPSNVCNGGHCAPTCTTSADCPSGRQCRVGACERTCNNDGDCPSGRVCQPGGLCGPPCLVDRECPAGQVCGNGHCQAGTPCTGDNQCGSRICSGGICHEPCLSTSECPAGDVCSGGRCVKPKQCQSDPDCPGQVCVGGVCVQPCHDDLECPANQRCDQGRCVAGCASSTECPAGDSCVHGRCEPPCGIANPCPAGQICVVGACQPDPTDCTHVTCQPGTYCDKGVCVGGNIDGGHAGDGGGGGGDGGGGGGDGGGGGGDGGGGSGDGGANGDGGSVNPLRPKGCGCSCGQPAGLLAPFVFLLKPRRRRRG